MNRYNLLDNVLSDVSDDFKPNYIGNEESDMTIFAKTFTFETEMVVFKDLSTSKEINIIDKLEELENKVNNLFNYITETLNEINK
jgi:hypothetical protein